MSAPHNMPLADVVFISEFAAFCRTKGDERYCASDTFNCAVAQYGYVGALHPDVPQVPKAAFDAAVYGETGDGSGTFSALADRLEALISDSPSVRVL